MARDATVLRLGIESRVAFRPFFVVTASAVCFIVWLHEIRCCRQLSRLRKALSKSVKSRSPPSAPEDVLLEVANVGVCGSRLASVDGGSLLAGESSASCSGMSSAGTSLKSGKDVEGWKEGDRVVSETAAIISKDNPMTRRGLYNLDNTRKGFGYGVNGAMTKYVRVPSRILHHVPDAAAL